MFIGLNVSEEARRERREQPTVQQPDFEGSSLQDKVSGNEQLNTGIKGGGGTYTHFFSRCLMQ